MKEGHGTPGIRAKLPELLATLSKADDVIIGTHVGPDGDALGSSLAMSLYLDEIGIANEVICASDVPEYLQFLPGCSRIRKQPERSGHDVALVLDLEALYRLGSARPYFEACPKIVLIDHHVPNEAAGHLRIVNVASPATCAILTDLLLAVEGAITPDIATCLLVGIVTDTGSFRFRNTTPHSLHLAAKLLQKGGDIVQVAEEVYQNKDLAALKLESSAISRMHLSEDKRVAWSTLPVEIFREAGAREEHNEGIVNELLSVKTVCVAALIREAVPGKVRASLRSRGGFDVAAVARIFGGGGHVNAAGISFDGTIEEAERAIVAELRRCLESS